MIKSPLELINHYYACFNRADSEGLLNCLHEDVIHEINQGIVEQGRDAFRQFMAHMMRCYDEKISELMVMQDASGIRLAAEYIVVGKYMKTDNNLPPATGQTYRIPGGAFFTLKQDKIARIANYYNLHLWLKQIGAGSTWTP